MLQIYVALLIAFVLALLAYILSNNFAVAVVVFDTLAVVVIVLQAVYNDT